LKAMFGVVEDFKQKDPRVCRDHFKEEDYSNYIQHTVAPHLYPKLLLKRTAVPSVFPKKKPVGARFQVEGQTHPDHTPTKVEWQRDEIDEPLAKVARLQCADETAEIVEEVVVTKVEEQEASDVKTDDLDPIQIQGTEQAQAANIKTEEEEKPAYYNPPEVEDEFANIPSEMEDEVADIPPKVEERANYIQNELQEQRASMNTDAKKEATHMHSSDEVDPIQIEAVEQPSHFLPGVEEQVAHIQTETEEPAEAHIQNEEETVAKIANLCAENERVVGSAAIVANVKTQTAASLMTTKETQCKPELKSQGTNFRPATKCVATSFRPVTKAVTTQAHNQREADLNEELKQLKKQATRLAAEVVRWKKRSLK